MRQSIEGRLKNLKLHANDAMKAVFEAVQNGIDATREKGNGGKNVTVEFDIEGGLLPDDIAFPAYFKIIDEGVGFTGENYESFWTADSQKKQRSGGKGCGRFLWLKVFSYAEIDSVFESDGKRYRRTFRFDAQSKPVDATCDEVDNQTPLTTSITLQTPLSPYIEKLPSTKEDVATSIMHHFILNFLPEDGVDVVVIKKGETGEESIKEHISQHFQKLGKSEFPLDNGEIQLEHFSSAPGSGSRCHEIHLCANMRVVETISIPNSEIRSPLYEPDGTTKFRIDVYATAPTLDESVDPATRSRIELQHDNTQTSLFGEPSAQRNLKSKLIEAVAEYHKDVILPMQAHNLAVIKQRVSENHKLAPFAYILHERPEVVQDIDSNLDDQALRRHLAKREFEWKSDKQDEAERILDELDDTTSDLDAAVSKFDSVIKGPLASELAHYMVTRKTVIQYARKLLRRDASGKHQMESAFHELVMPMRTTNREARSQSHNLWLLDERLTYKAYVASDTSLRSKNSPVQTDSGLEPDIMAFEGAVLCRNKNSNGGFYIVEFKRPGERPSSKVNQQVINYVRSIREGRMEAFDGSHIHIELNTPVFAHIVADLTPDMKRQLVDDGFKASPESGEYHYYHESHNIWFRFRTFEKVLQDADVRHQAFFDKLKLS